MFLARKITRAKWNPKNGLSAGEIPADAVTVDLRTRENSLSFWRCGLGEKEQVEEAALAIAAAGDRVDSLTSFGLQMMNLALTVRRGAIRTDRHLLQT